MQHIRTVREASPHAFRRQMRANIARRRKAEDDGDVRLFLLSFAAFFVCFYSFLL